MCHRCGYECVIAAASAASLAPAHVCQKITETIMSDATLACLALSVLPVTALFWVSASPTTEEPPDAAAANKNNSFFERLLFLCDQGVSYEDMVLQCAECTSSCYHNQECFGLRLDHGSEIDDDDDDDGVEDSQ